MKLRRSTIFFAVTLSSVASIAQTRVSGTATVRTADTEYAIPIECDDANRPELGISTEPARITREATGRTSGVNLRIRRWQETDELVVSLDRYVAWMPAPSSAGGKLTIELDMSPASITRDGRPTLLTHEMWSNGDRPAGLQSVRIEADCTMRSPDVPTTRRISN